MQVYHQSEETGKAVNPNGDGLHPGRVKRVVGGTMETLEECWILFVDEFDQKAGNVAAKQGDYYGPARLAGIKTSAGGCRPLYLVRRGTEPEDSLVFFELYTSLNLGGTAEAYLLQPDGEGWTAPVNGDDLVTVQDPYSEGMWQGSSGYRGFAKKHPGGENYDIVFMEEIARWICYELLEDLPALPAGVAQATVLSYQDGKIPPPVVDVYDFPLTAMGIHSPWHKKYSRGWAKWNDFYRRYEIVIAQYLCMTVDGTLAEPMCEKINSRPGSNGKYDVAFLHGWPQGLHSDVILPNAISVYNPRGHKAQVYTKVLLFGQTDQAEPLGIRWEVIDVESVPLEVMTGVEFDADTCEIRFRTKTIAAELCTTEEGNITLPMTSKTVVTNIEQTSGVETVGEEEVPYCRTVKTMQELCVFEKLDEEDNPIITTETVIEFTARPVIDELRHLSHSIDGHVCYVWSPCFDEEECEWVGQIDTAECPPPEE